jgi:hypothetical protein
MGIYPYQEYCVGVVVNAAEHQRLLNLFPGIPGRWKLSKAADVYVWHIPSSLTRDYLTREQWDRGIENGLFDRRYQHALSDALQLGADCKLPAELTDTPALQQLTAIATAVGKVVGRVVVFSCGCTL